MRHLAPFFYAFFIILVAELGDKTQILVMALAAKYPMEKVLYGVFSAAATLMLIAVMLGGLIHRILHPLFISIFSGAFFIIMGLTMLIPMPEKDAISGKKPTITSNSVFWTVFGSFFLAELGDKTQLAAFALSAKYSAPLLLWTGATLGMFIADLFGIGIGNILRNYLPDRVVKKLAGCLFVLFGLITFLGILR